MFQIAMVRAPVSVMKCLTQWFLAIFMEHRLNTQHSVAQFIVDFSVVLQENVHQLLSMFMFLSR